jgi:predicted PurR-regulated permease PerM
MSSENDSRRLSDLTVGDAKRILVYGIVVLLAVWLFAWLIGHVLVALLLGVVAGAYLLPVQEWFERRLRARSESALVTIALIVVPLVALIGYAWYELSNYSALVQDQRNEIIGAISRALTRYFPVTYESTRTSLESAFIEAVTRSADAVENLRRQSALLFASVALFFFTVFYVLTQRVRIASYVKLRVPGEYLTLYEKLTENIGGALRGAVWAVFIDQLIRSLIILVLNIALGVPLAIVLAIASFFLGFLPLIGGWIIYIPVSIYLLVFRDSPVAAAIYFGAGIVMNIASSLFIRPKLAAQSAGRFSFYWMLLALVAGVYTFGMSGLILGPAIIGLLKAVADTLFGNVNYSTSLLKEELEQETEKNG